MLEALPKELEIPNVRAKLNQEEAVFRAKILAALLANKYENKESDLPMLRQLAAKNVFSLKGDALLYAYPLANFKTNKIVSCNERRFHAMCALDAIGCFYLLKQEIRIFSQCENSSTNLEFLVNEQGVKSLNEVKESEIRLFYPDLNRCEIWGDKCCKLMHFFKSQKDINEFFADKNTCNCYSLDLDTAYEVAGKLFA